MPANLPGRMMPYLSAARSLLHLAWVQAGLAASAVVGAASQAEWANAAYAVMVAVGVVGAGLLALWGNIDRQRIASKKLWDEANKESLTAQLESLRAALAEHTNNQEKMRASLHELRNEANARRLEADGLRDDLVKMSRELRLATGELHKARVALSDANRRIDTLTRELEAYRRENRADVKSAVREAMTDSMADFPTADMPTIVAHEPKHEPKPETPPERPAS